MAGIRRLQEIENSSVWKDRVIIASTCRRCVPVVTLPERDDKNAAFV